MRNQPQILKNIAIFIRDLLDYDEQLIKFDRDNMPEKDFTTSYIVVNGSSIVNKTSSGSVFNGDTEVMQYDISESRQIILEFYGSDAFINSGNFSLLTQSQKAYDLKRNLYLSIGRVSKATDVAQVLGNTFGNRVHLEMNVQYNESVNVETLRIDTAQFEFLEDK